MTGTDLFNEKNDGNDSVELLRNSSLNESLNISNFDTSNSSNYSVQWLANNTQCIKIACANARSVVHKIDSLITLFEECELHMALLTETWLTPHVQ